MSKKLEIFLITVALMCVGGLLSWIRPIEPMIMMLFFVWFAWIMLIFVRSENEIDVIVKKQLKRKYYIVVLINDLSKEELKRLDDKYDNSLVRSHHDKSIAFKGVNK